MEKDSHIRLKTAIRNYLKSKKDEGLIKAMNGYYENGEIEKVKKEIEKMTTR